MAPDGQTLAPNVYDAEPIPDAARAEIDRLLSSGDLFRYTAAEGAPVAVTYTIKDGDGDLGFEDLSTDDCELCDSSCYTHPTFTLFILDNRFNVFNGDSLQVRNIFLAK